MSAEPNADGTVDIELVTETFFAFFVSHSVTSIQPLLIIRIQSDHWSVRMSPTLVTSEHLKPDFLERVDFSSKNLNFKTCVVGPKKPECTETEDRTALRLGQWNFS